MALQRRHRFQSLEEHDDKDEIIAGSQFIVKYIGSAYAEELEKAKTQEFLADLYSDFVEKFQMMKSSLFRLVIDLSGAAFYNKAGDASIRFNLCDIRDVIYCPKKQEYSKHFILIGKEESTSNVKAHLMLCKTSEEAKILYETFIKTFSLGAEMMRCKRQSSCSTAGGSPVKHNNCRGTNACLTRPPKYTGKFCTFQNHNGLDSSHIIKKWNSTSALSGCLKQDLDSQGNDENYLEDCFTQLAKSRSCSSDTSLPLSASESRNRFQDFSLSEDVFY